jgi:hypothetical protein
VLPVVIIVCLSAPAWLSWPFLPKDRRDSVIEMVNSLKAWVVGSAEPSN